MTQRGVCPARPPRPPLQPSSTDAQVFLLPIRPGRWREECVCPSVSGLLDSRKHPAAGSADKGRLTTERTPFISVNTVAVRPSTQRFTFLLNHTGKLETLLLAWAS